MCVVIDGAPGMADPDNAGRQRAAVAASAGRGLWIVRQVADTVDIASGPDGLTVTVTFGLG